MTIIIEYIYVYYTCFSDVILARCAWNTLFLSIIGSPCSTWGKLDNSTLKLASTDGSAFTKKEIADNLIFEGLFFIWHTHL